MKRAGFWALRLGLGGLFLFAGVMKLRDPGAFAIEVVNYQLFPALGPLMAVTLPPVEIALAVAMLAGSRLWIRAGAIGAGLLLAVFTAAVISVVLRGINISCGCFGGDTGPVTLLTVARDGALLGAAAALAWLARDARPLGGAAA